MCSSVSGSLQQRIVEQIDLADREVVRGAPPGIDQARAPRRTAVRHRTAWRRRSWRLLSERRPSPRLASLMRARLIAGAATSSSSRRVCRATIRFSSVGMIQADTVTRLGEIRGPPASLAASSSAIPSQRRRPADLGADRRRVLADAAGEDERVEPAERGGQRAELAADAVDEQIDRLLRAAGRALASKVAHVARHARDAEQARFAGRAASRSRRRPCPRAAADRGRRRGRARRCACPSPARRPG